MQTFAWVCVGVCGCARVYMCVCKYAWVCVGVNGCAQMYLIVNVCARVSVGMCVWEIHQLLIHINSFVQMSSDSLMNLS